LRLLTVVLIVPLAFVMGRYPSHLLESVAPASSASQVDVKSLILKVKADLYGAEQEAIARGEAPLLHLEDVELEIAFVANAKAGGEVELLAVTSSSSVEMSRTQRVKLRLSPVASKQLTIDPSPGPIRSGSDAPAVIGPSPFKTWPGSSQGVHKGGCR